MTSIGRTLSRLRVAKAGGSKPLRIDRPEPKGTIVYIDQAASSNTAMAVEKGNRGNGTPAACGVQNLDHALTWGLSSMSFLGELGMATGSEVSGPGRPAGEAVDAGREYSLVIP